MVLPNSSRPLRCVQTPIVLLTVTASPGLVPFIARAAGCSMESLLVIRANPARKNLLLEVQSLESGHMGVLK